MFKFNNNHIFTGYLKQLLASFNLPKCRVYTKEQQEYANSYAQRLAYKDELDKQIEIIDEQIDQLNSWNTVNTKGDKKAIVTILEEELAEITQLIDAYKARGLNALSSDDKASYRSLSRKLHNAKVKAAETDLQIRLKEQEINQLQTEMEIARENGTATDQLQAKINILTKALENTALNNTVPIGLYHRRTYYQEKQGQIESDIALLVKKGIDSLDKTNLENDPEWLALLEELKEKYIAEKAAIELPINELSARKEALQKQKEQPVKKELNVIKTNYHSNYDVYPNSIFDITGTGETALFPATMRYVPYIKDGSIQEYTDKGWRASHSTFGASHEALHQAKKLPYNQMRYSYGQKILNYTKNLQIQNTIYDSYTHEYLGDYLRFHRDFANINLMPLYNCFSNRACPHLDISFPVSSTYTAVFKTDQSFETTLYKFYMVPVKFFKNYTIAIDSGSDIEVCCCIYDEYHNTDEDFTNIPKLTYQCFSDMQFRTPVLYSKLQNLNNLLEDSDSDLCQHEDSLKLILKLPINNNSSIVILEGDYINYNDASMQSNTEPNAKIVSLNPLTKVENHTIEPIKHSTNKTVINYENLNACKYLADKLITPLQLLRTNTSESYPFADRLVEYLVGNAITVNEEIQDNVVRAKTVISKNCPEEIYPMVSEDGIWEPILQCLTYDYINKKQNTHDINHDILGFIDKDVEKWYTAGSGSSSETIANIDIYKD